MKIRVISDLHIDVNEEYPFALKDKDIFAIICGDLSGHFNKSSKWIEENIKEGILVAGNHMSYNEYNHSIEYLHSQYQKKYPLNAQVSFMENQVGWHGSAPNAEQYEQAMNELDSALSALKEG